MQKHPPRTAIFIALTAHSTCSYGTRRPVGSATLSVTAPPRARTFVRNALGVPRRPLISAVLRLVDAGLTCAPIAPPLILRALHEAVQRTILSLSLLEADLP